LPLFPDDSCGYFFRGVHETEGRAPGNLHNDLPMTLKCGKKERQDKGCEDQGQPIRMLQAQPTKMLLSAHLISIQIDHFRLFYLNKLILLYLLRKINK
jgi:hypothetical protein